MSNSSESHASPEPVPQAKLRSPLMTGSTNRCPNCFTVALTLDGQEAGCDPECFPLCMTVNFATEKEQVSIAGWVEFGLAGGDLVFTLRDGAIEEGSRRPETPLRLSVAKEVEDSTSKTQSNKLTAGLGLQLKPKEGELEIGPSIAAEVEGQAETARKETFTREEWQLRSKGSGTKLTWSFSCAEHNQVLQGSLTGFRLGVLRIDSALCTVTAHFRVLPRELRVVRVLNHLESFDPIQKKIAQILLYKKYCKPHLSSARILFPLERT